MPGDAPQRVGERLGDLARRHAGGLGQLQGDVGGLVAVLADLRPLDPHLVRHGDGELAGGDGVGQAGADGSASSSGVTRRGYRRPGVAPAVGSHGAAIRPRRAP